MSTILDYMRTSGGNSPSGQQPKQSNKSQVLSSSTCNGNVLQPQLASNNMGKQIMQNMESVMRSLKRKQKHKKHLKKKANKASETVTAEGENSEEESLASLKTTWLSARKQEKEPQNPSKVESVSSVVVDDKKNAFKMLMLNGKTGQQPETALNDENQTKSTSPEWGKRRLSSGTNEKVKRRKVKGTDPSPKSPVKKRRKKKLFECFVETVEMKKTSPIERPSTPVVVDSQSESETVVTPQVRPRRSCASNVTYTETSPVSSKNKSTAKSSESSVKTSETIINKTSESSSKTKPKVAVPEATIIDLEKSPQASKKKLAPLFVKAVPKPSLDPKVLEARQSFLMSDLPEKMRQDIEKKKQVQEEVKFRQLALFPEISHVPAVFHEPYLALYEEEDLFPRSDTVLANDEELPFKSYFLEPPVHTAPLISIDSGRAVMSLVKTDAQKKKLVQSLKVTSEDEDFPLTTLFKSLTRKQKATNADSTLFTDLYCPADFKEFLFNQEVIQEMRDYLLGFVQPNGDTDSNGYYDTDDDECSNSVESFGGRQTQTLVLHGPCATGKTSAVYAIAGELNCNVIEINASSKRNGAQMLHKLMEATQSHKVPTAKMSLNRKMLRRMEREEKRMSIILIEDLDVIFSEDTGFLAAIGQLMSLTKRPIILTTNNRNAPNLRKTFESGANFKFLEFRKPLDKIDRCLTYLQLVGIVNGCNIDHEYLGRLFKWCGEDVRQSLFQLSFITLTKEIDLEWNRFEEEEQRQREIPCVNWQAVEAAEESEAESEPKTEHDCSELAWMLDNLCVAETWTNEETTEMDEFTNEMFALGSSLLSNQFEAVDTCRTINRTSFNSNSFKRITNKSNSMLPGKVVAQDVEPSLRNMCRSECSRRDVQRSTTKFSHYLLRDMDVDLLVFGAERSMKEELERLNGSCSIFKE